MGRSRPLRRTLRLPSFDYTSPGAYFVTICTHERDLLFAQPVYAEVARREWRSSATHRPEVALDAFVVMPNHVHGIVCLTSRAALPAAASTGHAGAVSPRSLGAFVRAYKAAVTRELNMLRGTPGAPVWQRNYYEHVVRDDRDLDRIRDYIAANPARWSFDRENPDGRADRAEREFWRGRA